MIHGDTQGANHQGVYPVQIYNEAPGSVDSFFERDITQQINDDSSLYQLNLESLHNIDPVDLRSIDSDDLIKIAENESSALNEYLETSSTLKMTENSPKVIPNDFPNLEEHDDAGYQFELNLNPNSSGKNYWYYSTKLQKVYIKLDQTFYIEALYSPPKADNENFYNGQQQQQQQQLYLRAMMVYIDDISSPVQRCHNHRNSDLSSEEHIRHYILRSENSGTEYKGESDGRNVNDRLSISIPLSYEKPNENNIIKKTIALKFVCQNSCIGRKQTAVIFTLEDSNRCLGKRIVNVKICSCPKRDKLKDEEKYSLKRSATYEQNNCPPHKIPSILKIKEEPTPSTSPLLVTSPTTNEENHKTDDFPEVKLTFTIPKHLAHDVVNAVFDKISGRMALDTKNAEKYRKYLKEEKKKLEQFSCTTSCRHGSGCSKF